MSNNKQLPNLTESLPVLDKVRAPSTTTVNVDMGIPEINQVTAAPQNLVQSAEASTVTPAHKLREKNDSLGILLDCAERGENRGKQRPPYICKVSRILRDLSVRSFIPQLVSIGPIHRENKKLKEFEWQKECYLNVLLNRFDDSKQKETILEASLQKVKKKIHQIRESYADVKNYGDEELARMMVMDGCFILEFCFKHEQVDLNFPNKMQPLRIAMDLMLLENQVPFFVLQALFDCLAPGIFKAKRSFTLTDVLDTHLAPYIKLFREKNSTTDVDSHLPEKISTIDVDSDSKKKENPAHVLGYLHKQYHLVAAKSSKPKLAEASKRVDEEQIENTAFHSIVELDRSGINFKRHQEDEWSMKIEFQSSLFACLSWFWSKHTLLMPTLVIDDTTELILRNFIAYEQSFPQDHYYFTSYAVAMDKLIDSKEDIAKLVESEVLVNNLGSNQEAADMINKICKNVSITDFYYTQEFKQMDKYYNALWTRSIKPWRRVLLDDPSTILLLYLSVIQTVYTIMGT